MCCCDRILLAAYTTASTSLGADQRVCTCGCGTCGTTDPIALARRKVWRAYLQARLMLRWRPTWQFADASTRK